MISEWWAQLGGMEKVFWGIALVFSVLFFIQFVLSLIGLDFIDDHNGASSSSGYHLDADFTLLSVRGIIAFFTFFGWTGVLTLGRGGSSFQALIFSILAGLAALLLVGWLFWIFSRLTQHNQVDIYKSLFTTAEVYIPIPGYKKGTGKILIELDGALREYDAITEGEEIRTGTKVKVLEIINDNTLVVFPLQAYDVEEHFMEPPKLH